MTAREASVNALRVFRQGRDFNAELERLSRQLSDRRERSLAKQITLGVVRNLALCDYYIAEKSSIRLNKLEPRALDILRVAVYQLAFLDKVPKSAAVNEAVTYARQKLNPRAAGFINAVLRALSGSLPEVEAKTKEERLSILYSHPEWLVREFISRFSEAETELLLRENNVEPPVFARVNTLKTTTGQLASELEAIGIDVRQSALEGTLELRGTGDITEIEAYRNGDFFVQDIASTRCALAVGATPGMRVIDACAAPGGKSFSIAAAMENNGEIHAFDTEQKLTLITDGAKRLGISIIRAKAGDSSVFDPALEACADRVLVDAPCSGFGVIRKKPEIRYKTEAEIAHLPQQAFAILDNCARYVKPGGALVYSTCTLLRSENEDVTERFLAQNPQFTLRSQETLLPHRDGCDGFYTAVMDKKL